MKFNFFAQHYLTILLLWIIIALDGCYFVNRAYSCFVYTFYDAENCPFNNIL